MRIGIVSETYPPEINGVALTVHGLAAGLAARGHTVELVRPRQAQPHADEPGILAMEVRGAALPRYPGLRFGLPAGRMLRRRWQRLRPDAVYIATEGPLGWSALRSAVRLGIPAATGFHTRFDAYADHYGAGFLTPLVRGHLRRFHRRAAATLVPTDALAEELRALGVDNACILRRAVDTALFHPGRRDPALRAQWGVDGSTPVMLYVGRIAPEKNLELAVRAFRAAQREMPKLRYVWVGDGPARAALAQANPDFVFAGVQRGEELARHYASADLFPFPSLSETFGNVILEALAAGLPVVAYAEGAAREHLRSGANGFAIEPGNEPSFIEAVAKLAANPSLIRHMGRAACASTAQLSPEAVVRDFESLLRRLAEEKRHADHPAAVAHA
ncbi:glycosyltransferase family 4 protein [Fulvimonas soli]|jgi:glycosyltransferase involved in cell wall biosynthesis|uniref:Glycosyltransferase involved in cell wall biosynthesis n=1 Tax=Fulvimonas soli TaxID=155197 RepID=A0A316I4B1_9GAMM|nr:glycosyltransferase family 1 protein [Fulvimonas soli]PWK85264.1 glycosyltransferase involved in cell wall biosynthesis [Fulvimonas soli]TNY26307.1 glycosyl transferase [Fulvimonas soli]